MSPERRPRRPGAGAPRGARGGGSASPRPAARAGAVRGRPAPGTHAGTGRAGEAAEHAASRRRRRDEDELGGEQVEGRQAVRELLRARTRAVSEVLVADGREPSPAIDEIVSLARASGTPVRHVSGQQLAARSTTEVPQGVVAFAEPLAPTDLAELVVRAGGPSGRQPLLVVFDGVTDPHNLGSALRSAVSAGATGAVLAKHRSAHVTATVAKAAAGAIEHLPIALVPGVGAALEQLGRAGVWTVGLDERGDRVVDELELATEPLALVLGAEGRGLATLTRKRCDVLARIPLEGPLSSLNVSAAAAVALFAIARRRAGRG